MDQELIEELRGTERRLCVLIESLRTDIQAVAERIRILDRKIEQRVLALERADRQG